MHPAKFQTLLQCGLSHHRAGRLMEADNCYRQLRLAAPKHFIVLQLSGLLAQQQNRIAEAIDWLGRAHRIDPRHSECETQLAVALLAAGRTAEAERHLRHVVGLAPRLREGWEALAYCLKTQDRLAEAVTCHARVVALESNFAAGWCNYGLTLSLLGRSAEALQCHERALRSEPNYLEAIYGRAQALHQLERIPEAVAEYDRVLQQQPRHHEARSYRLFALHNLEDISREALLAEHVTYGKMVGGPPPVNFGNSADPQRRLRIAVLSPDLRQHSCAYFLEPLLSHLDPRAFELYLYHDHFREDAVTARFRALAAGWRNFVGQPEPVVERAIRADAPDILVDLAGHTGMTCRLPLFARRLAPVQVTYLGYPDTTGVPAMDYRFTDGIVDPAPDADEFATESLVRFAPTAWTYQPPSDAPAVAAAPCLADGHVTFGCFNNLAKLTDRMLGVWAEILRCVPRARLRVKGRGLSDAAMRRRYLERFAGAGAPPERIDLLERTDDTGSHLALYNGIDIALDTFPYHGTTTTCEALWMGVPVISLAGDRHMSRVGASLLSAIGRPEWATSSVEHYIAAAVALATDPVALAQTRAGLRDRLRASPLLDHAGQARRFGEALRGCWAAWCRHRAAAPHLAA